MKTDKYSQWLDRGGFNIRYWAESHHPILHRIALYSEWAFSWTENPRRKSVFERTMTWAMGIIKDHFEQYMKKLFKKYHMFTPDSEAMEYQFFAELSRWDNAEANKRFKANQRLVK